MLQKFRRDRQNESIILAADSPQHFLPAAPSIFHHVQCEHLANSVAIVSINNHGAQQG